MLNYNCIVIEDEPLAVEIMEDYIAQVPFLSLKKICNDAISALEIINTASIDLIFLDLHLPKMKGLDFLKTLKNPPKVIIITAYHQYALKSYEFNVVDYLLKPVEFSRFLTAVNKMPMVNDKLFIDQLKNNTEQNKPHLFVNVARKKVKIYLHEILFIEGQKEYVKITMLSKTVITKQQLSSIHELLLTENFIRIHKSFIVAKDKIEIYSINDIEINGKVLPIGRSYKEYVQSQLQIK